MKHSHSFPWTEHFTYPLKIPTIMTTLNKLFSSELGNLVNQIDNNENKNELIELINQQVSDDTYIVSKEFY
mgnify:CR=1 FL=1